MRKQKWIGAPKVIEETGELQQAIAKLTYLKAPKNDTRIQDVNEEIADVWAALDFMIDQNSEVLDIEFILERKAKKYRRFNERHREEGMAGL